MSDSAYLVIRDGLKKNNVFRLSPEKVTLIGRAPTCEVVVKDERCSRRHAEVFYEGKTWHVRDLESRNGTFLQESRVEESQVLEAGNVIRVGRTQIIFVNDLQQAFSGLRFRSTDMVESRHSEPDGMDRNASHPDLGKGVGLRAEDTSKSSVFNTDQQTDLSDFDESHVLFTEETLITHQRVHSSVYQPEDELSGEIPLDVPAQHSIANLCKLGFELSKAQDQKSLLNLALKTLLEELPVDMAAVLLFPDGNPAYQDAEFLEVAASCSKTQKIYRRISDYLAHTVLSSTNAVLARHVMGDSVLGRRDSSGNVDATSVICAPLRLHDRILGLIHLYSTDSMQIPDDMHLDFTLSVADALAVAVDNLNQRQELAESLTLTQSENALLRQRLGTQCEMVGHSRALENVAEQVNLASSSKSTVLIRGESGVGKELVARGVHFSSSRCKGPFICLNCAALSEDLLTSELFGHEKGAFTGATERKIGKFEAADGGTLMLDEIGEMSPGIQAKFLRVLEGHVFERVGGNKPIRVDVRVIAATNRNLEQEVTAGRFRRDLFFRLCVLEIVVPPLRDRAEDIPELAQYFFLKFRDETGRKIHGFTPQAMQKLVSHHWPGNVRELKNVIERAVVLCRHEEICPEDLLLSSLDNLDDGALNKRETEKESLFLPCTLDELESHHIQQMLQYTGGNKSRAAQLLGIERSTLDRKLKKF